MGKAWFIGAYELARRAEAGRLRVRAQRAPPLREHVAQRRPRQPTAAAKAVPQ
jgi:hypothetical protein